VREFHLSDARARISAAARRCGKTTAAAGEAARLALSAPGRGWIVAPILAQCLECFVALRQIIPPELVLACRTQPWPEILLANGSRIEARSAQFPAHLRGAGLDWLVVDEAAHVREAAWKTVYPATSDRQGRIILLSTPHGKNWFYREWRRAERQAKGYAGWLFTSRESPLFPAAEWERAQAVLPQESFAQEYEAVFIESGFRVFADWQSCRNKEKKLAGREKKQPGREPCRQHAIGVDLAKTQDWTVAAVLRPSAERDGPWRLVAIERFSRLAWPKQWERLEQILRRYPGRMLLDETGVGSPVVDEMRQRMPGAVVGRKFTAANRTALIENLQIAVESRSVRWPECAKTRPLEKELDEFCYRKRGARLVPEAPEGEHDDCVIALALAVWATSHATKMVMI